MELRRKDKFQLNYLAIGFAIPFVGMLFVMLISGYEPFGKYSMLYSDMYHQYYPFFVEFRRALRSGDSLLYTWSVGMGMDYLGLIAYYLASPLNLLSVLVPEAWLLEFFSLLVPLKLGLAGLSFSYFLKKIFGRDDISISVFGGFYGLCAWALGFQWNIMWLDTFALLPLVALGTISLLRDGKFVLYTLTLFLSVFSNYYIGLFTCFFVFLLFFVYQFCRWGGWKKFFSDFVQIGIFSVLAIGMTLILTLPALTALQTTQSSVNKFPTGFRLNIADKNTFMGLLDAMRQVIGNMGGAIEPNFKEGLPNVYCGIASISLMVLYLISDQIPWREKICTVGLLLFFNVSFIIRQLDYIWHGFHFTNMIPYRFSFLYSFVVLFMAYRAWILRGKFSPLYLCAAGMFTAAILMFSESVGDKTTLTLFSVDLEVPVYLLYNGFFLVMYMISFLYGTIQIEVPEDATEKEMIDIYREQKKMRRTSSWLLLGVMAVELMGTLICFGLYFTGTSVSNYPKGTEYSASVIRYMKEREADNLFYRAETNHSQTLNDGALNGYNGITAFTSSANVNITLFLQSLGFSAKNTYNRYLYEESSPVANLFLGIKYMIERDGLDKENAYFKEVNSFGSVSLLENQAYLPLGFLVEPELADVVFDSGINPFHMQNAILSAATGMQEEFWTRIVGSNLTITGSDGVTISDTGSTGFCRYTTERSSDVTFSYQVNQDGFACLYLDLPKRNDYHVSVNGVELYRETISLPQMIAVSDVKVGDVIDVRVVCKAGETSSMNVNAGILNGELFREAYDILNSSMLDLTHFENTMVSGVIQCNRDDLLYTSIPQNGNWKAYVDGEEVHTVMVGECMAAVELTQGVHQVTFRYHNRAFSLGWKLSLMFFLVFMTIVQWMYRPDWKKLLTNVTNKKYFS